MVIVFIFLFLLMPGRTSSFCMSKGGISKQCVFDDGTPIMGAKVNVTGGGTNYTNTTDSDGWANFTGLPCPGAYTIYVDVDGDGEWDGVPDFVAFGLDGGTEIVINIFDPSLGMQKLE